MRRLYLTLALIAAAGLLATPPAAPKRKKPVKCKAGFVKRGKRCVRKPVPEIRGGRYQGNGEEVGITVEINTDRKTMEFFYGPGTIMTGCVTGFGQPFQESAPSGPAPPENKIPSVKVGASFTYKGQRTQQDSGGYGYLETNTTTWEVTGRFPTTRKITGTLKWTISHTGDNHPDPHYRRAPRSCSRQVNFTLNAS